MKKNITTLLKNNSDYDNCSLEEMTNKLKDISERLASGQVGIEDACKLYEEGIILRHKCIEKIKGVKMKIQKINNDYDVEDINELFADIKNKE